MSVKRWMLRLAGLLLCAALFPAMASADCAHDGGTSDVVEWDDWEALCYVSVDNTYHTVTGAGTIDTYCNDCWKLLSSVHMSRVVLTEHHNYEGGVCEECFHRNTCPHAHTHPESEWADGGERTVASLNDSCHRWTGPGTVVTWCDDCGERFGPRETTLTETEPHDYGADGVCTVCGHKKVATGLRITAQPRDVTVTSGQVAVFSVVATDAATYQWYYRTGPAAGWNRIKSGTVPTLRVRTRYAYTKYQYACDVRDASGKKVTTDIVTLTVKPQRPIITRQPVNVKVKNGQVATFTVAADKAETYQWFYRTSADAAWVRIKTGTTATLKVKAKLAFNKYQYACDVRNADGKTTTSVVTLTVTKALPAITLQPISQTVKRNARVTFTVKATNADSFQWYYRKNAGDSWHRIGGATKTAYSFKVTSSHNGYQYACDIRNADGKVTTRIVTLTVK